MRKKFCKMTSTKMKSIQKLLASLTYDCDINLGLIKTNLYHVVH